MHVTESLFVVNRATSTPVSVLRYFEDKDLTSSLASLCHVGMSHLISTCFMPKISP